MTAACRVVIFSCAALVRRPLLRMSFAVSSKVLVTRLLFFAFVLLAFVAMEHLDLEFHLSGLGRLSYVTRYFATAVSFHSSPRPGPRAVTVPSMISAGWTRM